MAQGRDDYAQLEEGRSKLLLSTVPQGLERGHRGSETSHSLGGAKF